MTAAEEPPLVISDLPLECLVECLGYLEAHELLIVAATCRTMHEAAGTDVLWRALCVREQHGQSLDFRQSLGSFEHPCAPPLEPAAQQSGAAVWRHVYHASRQSLRRRWPAPPARGRLLLESAPRGPAPPARRRWGGHQSRPRRGTRPVTPLYRCYSYTSYQYSYTSYQYSYTLHKYSYALSKYSYTV